MLCKYIFIVRRYVENIVKFQWIQNVIIWNKYFCGFLSWKQCIEVGHFAVSNKRITEKFKNVYIKTLNMHDFVDYQLQLIHIKSFISS